MRLISKAIDNYDWLKSPLKSYRSYKLDYGVYQIKNSLDSTFLVISKGTEREQERLAKEIEIAKYPLDPQEISIITSHLRYRMAQESDLSNKTYRLPLRQADQLFFDAGVYFRLGLINIRKSLRFQILRAYSHIYQFGFVRDEWSTLDVQEFQRLADMGASLSEIAEELARTYNEVCTAQERFGIVMMQKKRAYHYWSDEDVAILRENVGKLTYREIQEQFFPHRSLRNVITNARKLNLSGGKRGRPFKKPQPEIVVSGVDDEL